MTTDTHTDTHDPTIDAQTDEQIDMLDDLADALYELEAVSDLDDETVVELTDHTAADYKRVFGSVDHAVVELGYPPRDLADLDAELIIRALQVFAIARGETPSKRDFRDNGPFHPERVAAEFGTWNDGLLVAGVDTLGIRVALGECLPDPDDPFRIYDREEYAEHVEIAESATS